MGDQTLCSAFSPGMYTCTAIIFSFTVTLYTARALAGGKYFVTGGTDCIIRVYVCIPGPPTLEAELGGHTVSD